MTPTLDTLRNVATVLRSNMWRTYVVAPNGDYWTIATGLPTRSAALKAAEATGLEVVPWREAKKRGRGRRLGAWVMS